VRAPSLRHRRTCSLCVCVQKDRALTCATEEPCRWTCLDPPYTYSRKHGEQKKNLKFFRISVFFNFTHTNTKSLQKVKIEKFLTVKFEQWKKTVSLTKHMLRMLRMLSATGGNAQQPLASMPTVMTLLRKPPSRSGLVLSLVLRLSTRSTRSTTSTPYIP
jgi:hypothetical protein